MCIFSQGILLNHPYKESSTYLLYLKQQNNQGFLYSLIFQAYEQAVRQQQGKLSSIICKKKKIKATSKHANLDIYVIRDTS